MKSNKPTIKTNKLNQYDNGIKKWPSKEMKKRKKNPYNPNSPILLVFVLNMYCLKKTPYPNTENKQNKI